MSNQEICLEALHVIDKLPVSHLFDLIPLRFDIYSVPGLVYLVPHLSAYKYQPWQLNVIHKPKPPAAEALGSISARLRLAQLRTLSEYLGFSYYRRFLTAR